MPLPVRLGVGVISIYGVDSPNNLSSYNPNIIFGVVDAVYLDIPCGYSVGQVVFIDKTIAQSLVYENTEYFLVPEQKILGVENEPT